MAKDKTIFVLKSDNRILFIATGLLAIYRCIKSKVNHDYSRYLRSYTQYSRYLTRFTSIEIPIPYSPPFIIEKHCLRKKFKINEVQVEQTRKFMTSSERMGRVEVHPKG